MTWEHHVQSFLLRERETFVFQNSFSFGLLHISFDCLTTHFNFEKEKSACKCQ